MSKASKAMCEGLKPMEARMSEHIQRKQEFIDLKKREIQRQIEEEC